MMNGLTTHDACCHVIIMMGMTSSCASRVLGSLQPMRPKIGLSFDSMGEAYAYYNLYSWECGFGRYSLRLSLLIVPVSLGHQFNLYNLNYIM
jgi:hypothetical protein